MEGRSWKGNGSAERMIGKMWSSRGVRRGGRLEGLDGRAGRLPEMRRGSGR